MADQVAGASLADAQAVIDVGAQLHATWRYHRELAWLDDASHFAHVDAVDAFVACVTPFFSRPHPDSAAG